MNSEEKTRQLEYAIYGLVMLMGAFFLGLAVVLTPIGVAIFLGVSGGILFAASIAGLVCSVWTYYFNQPTTLDIYIINAPVATDAAHPNDTSPVEYTLLLYKKKAFIHKAVGRRSLLAEAVAEETVITHYSCKL